MILIRTIKRPKDTNIHREEKEKRKRRVGMSVDVKLSCEETPLAWPASVALTDLTACSTCALKLYAPNPGSLQVLTRRSGSGRGDGVTVDESISVGADYRGQRYSIEEAVFHTPGLHVFPGEKGVLSAEYHIHMRTMTSPIRYITIVIPASHKLTVNPKTEAYFNAIAAKPDPAVRRPTLESLFVSSQVIQYMGPDIRGRTADADSVSCSSGSGSGSGKERQFLLVLNPVYISAKDLERIPREGSLSTDPRDLPANGIKPKKAVSRDRLIKSVVLASPGIVLDSKQTQTNTTNTTNAPPAKKELECKPLKVVNGRTVVDVSGKSVDLGLTGQDEEDGDLTQSSEFVDTVIAKTLMILGTLLGLAFSEYMISEPLWGYMFIDSNPRVTTWEPLKKVFYCLIVFGSAAIPGF